MYTRIALKECQVILQGRTSKDICYLVAPISPFPTEIQHADATYQAIVYRKKLFRGCSNTLKGTRMLRCKAPEL